MVNELLSRITYLPANFLGNIIDYDGLGISALAHSHISLRLSYLIFLLSVFIVIFVVLTDLILSVIVLLIFNVIQFL